MKFLTKSRRDKDGMPPIHIDTSLLEHRFCEMICGGIQTAHSGAMLRQEVILSSNMDGMSIGVTAVGLMRRVRLQGHTWCHTRKMHIVMQFDFFSLEVEY